MSRCVAEQVAAAIKAALDRVVESGDAREARRPVRAGLPTSPGHQSLYLLADDPVADEEAQVHGYTTWDQEFVVLCYARPSDDSTQPVDTILNELRARVEQEIMRDITLAGAAINTRVGDPIGFEDAAEGWSAVAAVVRATYRHLETDPYTQ